MPISQATILAIYGDLCDLVEKIDTLRSLALQGNLFTKTEDRERLATAYIEGLYDAAKDAQRLAIDHIMRDDRKIRVNPLTGRLDE